MQAYGKGLKTWLTTKYNFTDYKHLETDFNNQQMGTT